MEGINSRKMSVEMTLINNKNNNNNNNNSGGNYVQMQANAAVFMKLQLGRQRVIIRRIKFHCFIRTLPIACNKNARKKQRILHGRTEIRNFSWRVKTYSTSERSKRLKYFSTRFFFSQWLVFVMFIKLIIGRELCALKTLELKFWLKFIIFRIF